MAKKDEDYQAGFNDCAEQLQKTHISLDEVTSTFDKFLDKINKMKRVYLGIYNHFRKNLSLEQIEMKTTKEKRVNIQEILKLIELDMLADQK